MRSPDCNRTYIFRPCHGSRLIAHDGRRFRSAAAGRPSSARRTRAPARPPRRSAPPASPPCAGGAWRWRRKWERIRKWESFGRNCSGRRICCWAAAVVLVILQNRSHDSAFWKSFSLCNRHSVKRETCCHYPIINHHHHMIIITMVLSSYDDHHHQNRSAFLSKNVNLFNFWWTGNFLILNLSAKIHLCDEKTFS